jgi:hypothetical protein
VDVNSEPLNSEPLPRDSRSRKLFSYGIHVALVISAPVLWGMIGLYAQSNALAGGQSGAQTGTQAVADSEPTISTDRPSVANSSIVVPKGYLQFENGMLITRTQGDYVLDLPETVVRFGLLDKTELRFTVPDYYHTLSSEGGSFSGFGDMAIGVKQQLGPIAENFNLAAILFLSLPTGAQAISSHGYDPGLQFPWSRQLSANWTASGQVAFYWPTLAGQHNFTGETTFVFDRQLTKPWDAFIEYVGDFPDRGGSRQLLHVGSSYKLTSRQQIDFQLAAGLTNAAPNMYVGVGYSFFFCAVK